MPYRDRAITPRFLPLHWETGRTYDPGLRVETERFVDRLKLATSPIWQQAPLTKRGREAVLRPAGAVLPSALIAGWRVRRLGEKEPFALVLRLKNHFMHGSLISASPERMHMDFMDRCLVLTSDQVIAVHGSDETWALSQLGDVMVGTYPRPRRRARPLPLPAEDAEALRWL